MEPGRFRILRKRYFWWPLVTLLVLWEALYLPHLRTAPGWYADETATLALSRNLFHGESAMGSYWMTYWHCYLPYFPGYLWPTGLLSAATGGDILGARFGNTVLALAIAMLIYFAGRARFGLWPALLGAVLFLSYDQNVIHFRWIYSHNAVALGFCVAALYLLRPSRPRNDWKAGLGLAIGAMGHPLFAHGAVAAVVCRLKRPRSWVRLAIPPAGVVGATMLGILLIYWPKLWLWDDLQSLLAYYRTSDQVNSGWKIFPNFWEFFSSDIFLIGGFVGLLFCLRRRLYPLTLFSLVVAAILLKNRGNLYSFYYQAIVLTPLVAMGWAGGAVTVSRLVRRVASRGLARTFGGVLFVVPLGYAASSLAGAWNGQFMVRNQYLVTQNSAEVEAVAAWLNARTAAPDLVIANHNLAWLLHGRTADLIQAVLWTGKPAAYFEKGLPRERFRYPAGLAEAKYVAIGDIDERWTLEQTNVADAMKQITRENWPVVWRGQYYRVYANPRFTAGVPPQP